MRKPGRTACSTRRSASKRWLGSVVPAIESSTTRLIRQERRREPVQHGANHPRTIQTAARRQLPRQVRWLVTRNYTGYRRELEGDVRVCGGGCRESGLRGLPLRL